MMPEPPGPRGPEMEHGAPPLGPLPRLLAERRPEFAERLERLRARAPRRFAEVLVEVLLPRIEEALNEAERAPDEAQMPGPEGLGGPRAPHPPRPPGMERPEALPPEAVTRLRELLERDGRLEVRSRELADALRPPRVRDLPADKVESMRTELNQVVKDQFDVRSELRKAELQRLERELDRIRELLERTQRELERRERERDTIIESRLRQFCCR